MTISAPPLDAVVISDKRSTLYPWLIWALASGFLFYKYLLQVSPSIMVADLMNQFHLSGEGLGHLAAFYFYAYMLMQLPGGLLLDRVNLAVLLPSAILVCTVGAMLFALAPSLKVAQLGRVFIGLGGAFSAIGTMKLIALWFEAKRFAFVSGLMMSLGMLGAVGGQAPLSYLTEQLGWQQALLVCCLVGLVLSVLMYVGLAHKKQGMQHAPMRVKELGQQLKRLVSNPQCWLLGLFSGLAFAPISAFGGLWGVPFIAIKMNISTTQASVLTSIIFIGFAVGCPLSGYLSDLMSCRKPGMCLGTFLGCVMLCLIIYMPIHSFFVMSCLMFLFGFFTSFFFISFAMIREINALALGGTAIGFINTFDAVFGALSEPGVGGLLDLARQGPGVLYEVSHYHLALSVLPIASILGLLLTCFIKETRCKPID